MNLSQTITHTVGRSVLQAKKHSPHIFFAAGVVGVVGSAVLACRATLKLEETLDEIKMDVEKVQISEQLTEQEKQRVVMVKYGRGVLKLGRLYGPSAILGAASVAALAGSHVQLTRRNSALSATLAIVSQAYDDYRERVKQELGDEKELEIYHGVTEKKEVEIDGKKELVAVANPGGVSPYGRRFDSKNRNWQAKNLELNHYFIKCQREWCNHMLQRDGHLFLNTVYEHLGFEHTQEGAVVGWLRDGNGDGHVDFEPFDYIDEDYGLDNQLGIWLDFNVDGIIYDKI